MFAQNWNAEDDMPDAALQAGSLALYHSESCWFCARVRASLRELKIDLELRDIDRDAGRRQELIAGGGKQQVPCLRIVNPDQKVEWLYESADIIRFLTRNFGG